MNGEQWQVCGVYSLCGNCSQALDDLGPFLVSGVSSWDEGLEPTELSAYVYTSLFLITVTSESKGSYFTSLSRPYASFPLSPS